jgi:outer membrane protein OmpA-like peptidoglycan-associated protein
MRTRRVTLAAFFAVSFVASSLGADYPVNSLLFPIDTITFDVNTLNFRSQPITTETATTVEVTLPADVLFDFDKADVRVDAQQPLHEVAQIIRDKAHGPVMIQGYTDAIGNDAYNQRLSDRRAAAVKAWLISREGLASIQFQISGFGPRSPVAPNRNPDGSDNPAGRQMNRRVTFVMHR